VYKGFENKLFDAYISSDLFFETVEKPILQRLMENVHPADLSGTKSRGMRRMNSPVGGLRQRQKTSDSFFPFAFSLPPS
jgi:hypothetical protein